MTINNPEVSVIYDLGTNESNKMVLLSDYEALQVECRRLHAAIRRLCNIYEVEVRLDGEKREMYLDAAVKKAIDAAVGEDSHDHQ